ncbi:LOW QUALITY PROTEIN: Hypothetical protein PHPALM_3305 [Phytophthora palmivora]|uniref:Uncharacterized protein n=1 Tax=Phytophthora palmivora TaxID=4796 RepID=A0A2P4YMT0_9STRA|nr:LOW QUALITY PROTEIN: Hypothetical protein PHPALM_3305 [Phytophthora palmivora]
MGLDELKLGNTKCGEVVLQNRKIAGVLLHTASELPTNGGDRYRVGTIILGGDDGTRIHLVITCHFIEDHPREELLSISIDGTRSKSENFFSVSPHKRAKNTAITAIKTFVKSEHVEFDYVKHCIEQDATGKCFVSVLDEFGMYLAFNEGKKGKPLARNTALQYFRKVRFGCLISSPCNDISSKQSS